MATLEEVQVTSPRPRVAVVSFTGEHDLATCIPTSELLDSLLRTSDLVVADVTEARFVDSSMLSVLVDAHRLAGEQGKAFRIQLGEDAVVKRTFELSGVLETIPWAASRDAALNGSDGVEDGHGSRG
jgi:anti-anti-sigma factor